MTGGGDTAGKSEHVPVTPEQIANAAIEAAKAGRLHCPLPMSATRRPGRTAFRTELFREVVERIRESETDIVINLTGGNGGAIVIDDDKPGVWQEGSDLTTPEGRVAHAVELLPEICSLDTGSINFADNIVYLGHANAIREMARRMQAAGVKPEIEVFDVGPIMLARQLIDEGVIDAPPLFQFLPGHRAQRADRHQSATRDEGPAAGRRGLVKLRHIAPPNADGSEVNSARWQREGRLRG